MKADESDDPRSYTSKLGDIVKEFILQVKPFGDLLPLVTKAAAFLGGVLLVGYAAKEKFFYDLSSFAAISLLFITFFAFSLLFLLLLAYSVIITIWPFWSVVYIRTLIYRIRRRPVLTFQIRPYITWKVLAAYSFVLFLYMAILMSIAKGPVPWEIVGYSLLTGVVINLAISTRRSGESDRQRWWTFVTPLLLLFIFFLSARKSRFVPYLTIR